MVMRRNRRLLLLALGPAGAVLVVRRLRTPSAPMAEQPLPPPVVEPRKSPLQADAEGYYVPGYPFTVNGFRFTGFSLRPEALVTFAQTTVPCFEAQISAQNVHLRCDDPHVGTRSEEHTSELQSRLHLVCRLLLEKKKKKQAYFVQNCDTSKQ